MLKINLERAKEMVRDPKPGSAIAEGRAFGIDFSLNLKKLSLSLEERLQELQRGMIELEKIRGIGLSVTPKNTKNSNSIEQIS